jgi:hypothetical protein
MTPALIPLAISYLAPPDGQSGRVEGLAAGVGAGTGEHKGREGKRKIEPISFLGGGIGL